MLAKWPAIDVLSIASSAYARTETRQAAPVVQPPGAPLSKPDPGAVKISGTPEFGLEPSGVHAVFAVKYVVIDPPQFVCTS